MIKEKTTKMSAYLTVAAGASCIGGNAMGAVVFYGVDAANDINADPTGIDVRSNHVYTSPSSTTFFSFSVAEFGYFTRGTDLPGGIYAGNPLYIAGAGGFGYGAVFGNANFANMTFDGNDGVYEAVAQFYCL